MLAVRSRGDDGGGGTAEPGKLWYVSSQKVLDGSGTSGADAIQVAVAGYRANPEIKNVLVYYRYFCRDKVLGTESTIYR